MSFILLALPFFIIPYLILVYWIVKFHLAVSKSMGSKYEPRLATRHALENEEIGKIFHKRNFWGKVTLIGFILGTLIFAGAIYSEKHM